MPRFASPHYLLLIDADRAVRVIWYAFCTDDFQSKFSIRFNYFQQHFKFETFENNFQFCFREQDTKNIIAHFVRPGYGDTMPWLIRTCTENLNDAAVTKRGYTK